MAETMTEEQVQSELGTLAKAALAEPGGAASADDEAAQQAEAEKAAAEAKAKESAEGAGEDEGGDAEGEEEGEEEGGDEPAFKNPSQARNFRMLRDAAETIKAAHDREKTRADRLEQELQSLKQPPKKHPLEERLEKMDPEARERLKSDGVLDLLLGTVEEIKGLGSVKQTVEELRRDRDERAAMQRAEKAYHEALGRYAKENGLDDALLSEMDSLIEEGMVGGKDGRAMLDNARRVAEWKRATKPGSGKGGAEDKTSAAARKAAASGADASAGSAAGAPASGKKALAEKYDAALKDDPATADRILLEAMTNPSDHSRLPKAASRK